VLWIVPLALAVAGTVLLAVLAARVQREVPPTSRVLDEFGRTVRPALLRVRAETARTRRRFDQ